MSWCCRKNWNYGGDVASADKRCAEGGCGGLRAYLPPPMSLSYSDVSPRGRGTVDCWRSGRQESEEGVTGERNYGVCPLSDVASPDLSARAPHASFRSPQFWLHEKLSIWQFLQRQLLAALKTQASAQPNKHHVFCTHKTWLDDMQATKHVEVFARRAMHSIWCSHGIMGFFTSE